MASDSPDTREVEIHDEAGTDLGFRIRVGPAPSEPEDDDPTGVKTLAARITGWSTLRIEGEPYTYSKARALALLIRFPFMAEQISAPPETAA